MSTSIVIDHLSDINFKVLYSIIKTASQELLDVLQDAEIDYDKHASVSSDIFAMPNTRMFPLDSLNDTILSKVYFDHFKGKISEKVAEEAEYKINKYLALYNIPESIFEKKAVKIVKEASVKESVELLPSLGLCLVSTKDELEKAAKVFDTDKMNLTVAQRVEFSRNFVKVAGSFDFDEIPRDIAKYSSKLDTDLIRVKTMLGARAGMALRTGRDPDSYAKLAEYLNDPDMIEADDESLDKLAETIHKLDVKLGLDQPKYDRFIEDAYATVFTKDASEKSAEEGPNEIDALKELTKADLIGKFGTGVLEEIEDDEGTIDYDKLKNIAKFTQL